VLALLLMLRGKGVWALLGMAALLPTVYFAVAGARSTRAACA
jgi:hypothetical protein